MNKRLFIPLTRRPAKRMSPRPISKVSERSDITAVPALGVIAEAVVALVLADAMLEKFGSDALAEMRRNYDGYVAALGARWVESRGMDPR